MTKHLKGYLTTAFLNNFSFFRIEKQENMFNNKKQFVRIFNGFLIIV